MNGDESNFWAGDETGFGSPGRPASVAASSMYSFLLQLQRYLIDV